MRRAVTCLLALAFVQSSWGWAEAQQRRSATPYGSYPSQRSYSPRTAARTRSQGSDRGPAVPLPKEGDVVKQEITSTIISQVVMQGLKQPIALAVQPKTNELFVAEAGTGRIGRLNDVPRKYDIVNVIEGFEPGTELGTGLESIAFADKHTLVVAMRDASGQTPINVYRIPPAGKIEAADIRWQLDLNAEGQALVAEQIGLAWINGKLLVAGRGPARGFLSEVTWAGEGESSCQLLTNRAGEVDRPAAISVGRGGELWIANMGSSSDESDSSLLVYDPETHKATANIATGLRDLAGLAISPRTWRLYGIDRANGDEFGGLYRLDVKEDDGELVCMPAKLMSLNQPTALAFTPDGTLFIVTLGSHTNETQGGLLVRIYNESQL